MQENSTNIRFAPGKGQTRIVRDPRVCGGEPTVAGTRVPVRSIVVQWQHYRNAERVLASFPRLNSESIADALAFYDDNRAEIDRLIQESEQAAHTAD